MSFKETKHGFDFGENTLVITEHPFYNYITVGNSVRVDDAVMEDTTYVHEMSDGRDAVIIGFADFNLTIGGRRVRKTILDGLLAGEKSEAEKKLEKIIEYVYQYKDEAEDFINSNDKPRSIPYRDRYWLEKGIFAAYDALIVEVLNNSSEQSKNEVE